MRYICIQCGAGGASAADEKHPPASYNCHLCPPPAQPGSMWPEHQANLFREAWAAYKRANELAHSRPLTIYLADGFEHKVPYSAALMAFTHGDMQIRNPWLSECGRFNVDPQHYGFAGWDSGGGCVVLRKDLESGRYMLLSDSSGCDLPDASDEDLLGLYSKDGDPVAVIRLGHIPLSE